MKLVERNQQGQLTLTCPNCRQLTPVPANGTAGLQPAFHINNLLELQESFKKLSPVALEEAVSDSGANQPRRTVFCSEHPDKELELYCATCEEPICLKCVVKSGTHHGHDTELLSEAFEKYKREITTSLEPMERQLTTINKALVKLDTRCGEISNQQAATEANIRGTFTRLHEILDTRQAQLINELQHITHRKLKSLAVQRDQIETLLVQLSSCLDFVRESLKTEQEREVMVIKKTLELKVKEMTTSFQPDSLEPSMKADVTFIAPDDLHSACQKYGQVSLTSIPDPGKCYITTEKEIEVLVGEKSKTILYTVNCMGQPCETAPESLECKLVSGITGSCIHECKLVSGSTGSCIHECKLVSGSTGSCTHECKLVSGITGSCTHECKLVSGSTGSCIHECKLVSGITGSCIHGSVERRGQSQYEIRYRPTIKGRHQLHVKVEGQHIKGSPFRVTANLPTKRSTWRVSLPTKRSTPSCSISATVPRGLILDHSGNLVVAESINHSISVFSLSGKLLHSFGSYGTDKGQLAHPYGLAVDCEGNIIVADSYNHRIQKFSPDGQFLAAVGSEGSGPLQFSFPRRVTFNTINKKLYVADNNNRVQILNSDFTFCGAFGRGGAGKGQFDCPKGIACDSTGNVYVADGNNNRVQVFTAKGKFLRMFGRLGTDKGDLNTPIGIAVDRSGVIYVSENENCRISTFTAQGQFISCMGRQGEGPGEFLNLHELVVDSSGVVYVCDTGKNCIQIFK